MVLINVLWNYLPIPIGRLRKLFCYCQLSLPEEAGFLFSSIGAATLMYFGSHLLNIFHLHFPDNGTLCSSVEEASLYFRVFSA